jgi:sugar/nucleoside kinase (ribokinase family)
MSLDVLVVGDYCCDVILTGLPSQPVLGREVFADGLVLTIGGGTFPTAMALRRLGFQVGIHMQLGNDPLSQLARETIVNAGFDPTTLQFSDNPLRRLTVALSYPEDRAFLSYADDPPQGLDGVRFGEEVLRERPPRHIHFAHLSALLTAGPMIAAAHSEEISLSSDCGWNPRALDHPMVWSMLEQIDVFLPNESEACYLAGHEDVHLALTALAERIPIVGIKWGVRGSLGAKGAEIEHVPAIGVEPVDTTGAGDCFNAGFLYGYLQGWPLRRALGAGNICGGLSTRAGGWETTPDRAALEQRLSEGEP